MYQRVLLVVPPACTRQNALAEYPPAGLGYVAHALQRHGLTYQVLDMRLGNRERDLLQVAQDFQADLLAYSMLTYGYQDTYSLIQRARAALGIPAVVGGPHVSSLRERALMECSAIDYGVVLEGEETMAELCKGRELADIKGLIYRHDGQVVYTGDREFITDLSGLGFPTYQGFRLDRYVSRKMTLVTSRGCPYSCIYCPVHVAIGRKFRARSPQSVTDEIQYWHQRGYREFLIQDDNFTLVPQRVLEICAEIEKRNLEGLVLRLPNGVRADRVDRPLLEALKGIGLKSLCIGVEAGNDRILANIRKGERIADIEQAIAAACELGLNVGLFFLIGSPGETLADVEDSLRLAQRYPVGEAHFYNLIPFPGTELYIWVECQGYFVRPPSEYLNMASHFHNEPCFETPEMPLAQRKVAWARAQAVARDIRWRHLRRRLTRLGPLAGVAAWVYTSAPFARLHNQSPALRRWVNVLSHVVR